jgi:hypothetical protein
MRIAHTRLQHYFSMLVVAEQVAHTQLYSLHVHSVQSQMQAGKSTACLCTYVETLNAW